MRRVFQYPFNTLNPYQSLLVKALVSKGVDVVAVPESGFKALLSITYPKNISSGILHLHWLSEHIMNHARIIALIRALLLIGIVICWRVFGGRVIWTVHNISNHESKNIYIERFLSISISWLASLITVFGKSGVLPASRYFFLPPAKIKVVKHAKYFGETQFRVPALENDNVNFLFFGLLRPYKGLDLLIESFKEQFGHEHTLTIAGAAKDTVYLEKLSELKLGYENISIQPGWLNSEELIAQIDSCDVVVLPFLEIFMSGSLIAAVSAGRPVIVGDVGLVRDYVDDSVAFFFVPGDKQSLASALSRAARDPDRTIRSIRMRKRSDELSQDVIADDWRLIYESQS